MELLRKINRWISKILAIALVCMFAWMILALSIQVFGRYIFHVGFPWTEESARYVMIWAIFIGASYIALNGEHIKVSIIEDLMKKASGKTVMLIIQDIVSLIFAAIVLYFSFSQLGVAKLSVSPNTGLSMLVPYTVFPVSMILMIWAYVYRIADLLSLGKKK
jgi:TRAP-type C4-dicarboxylate transport system permease small subunit